MNAMTTPQEEQIEIPESLIEAVLSQQKVDEIPHSLYRYPARFAPSFARQAITSFSKEGDLVIDPFCGGGTTLLEAVKLGRRAAGMDVSTLATFISRVKTTPISVHDRRGLEAWRDQIANELPAGISGEGRFPEIDREHYERNLPPEALSFFSWIVERIAGLGTPRREAFARLILLSVGQWALDCKTTLPSILQLRDEFLQRLDDALVGYTDYLTGIAAENEIPRCRLGSMRRVINRSAEEIDQDGRIPKSWLPAKLVVTSPPYPGVHVVYHRWQIQGRKETPAPFWLANQRDGAGESFYTLGRRNEAGLPTYFERLKAVFQSLRPLLSDDAHVIQLVAFADPTWQLPEFLSAMREAGYVECLTPQLRESVVSGRLWRQVPGRKWYANKQGDIPASKEVLLVHRPSLISSQENNNGQPNV